MYSGSNACRSRPPLSISTYIAYLILKKSGRVKLSRWNRQSVQNQVTRLSLVAGSWLFHDDDDDDDANLWQLVLFAKIARCVSRFITKVKGVYVTTTSPCSRRLRLSKFSGSIGAPGVMRAQFRLIIKYVAGLLWSNRARRIARIKYANRLWDIYM